MGQPMSETPRGTPAKLMAEVLERNLGKSKTRPVPDDNKAAHLLSPTVPAISAVAGNSSDTPIMFQSGIRDLQPLMFVPLFSLSKTIRKSVHLRYKVSDGLYIDVQAGQAGLPTIWDYDLMMVVISQLTHAVNAFHSGRGPRPSNRLVMKTSDILNFCHRDAGGRQRLELERALARLRGTRVQFLRTDKTDAPIYTSSPEGLIGNFHVIPQPDHFVEIELSTWLLKMVAVSGQGKAQVLKISEDYFSLSSGVARFLYRLARRAAGRRTATWGFDTLHRNSGSTAKQNKFFELLRREIISNRLPEFSLSEAKGKGKGAPMLVIEKR